MTHRSDIDGMRAVAILPVLLFHTGVPYVSGGFAGVDVFFVISGYLITGLILDDIDKGKFSIARFYERRVRRILPALFFVLACASIAAYAILLPPHIRQFGWSLLATMLFSSNFLFAQQTDYFDAAGETRPLLHTWSLAVEEQFYILYPLLLFLVTRFFRKRYGIVLCSALGLSFAFSLWDVRWHPSSAFYSSPARAWELLLGGTLAIPAIPLLRKSMVANVLSLIGLMLLLGSFLALSGSHPFPGLNALYPTLGAALIIYSGKAHQTLVSTILSTRPLVFIGLISYSLYLWHWPLIVFAKYYSIRELNGWSICGLICASTVVAAFSWKFVERPFRGQGGLIRSRRALFMSAAAVSAAFILFSSVAYRTGFPYRFNKQVLALIASGDDYWTKRYSCRDRICRIGDSTAIPKFMLWGDSHAQAIAPAFEQIAAENHVAGFVAYDPGCAPLLGLKSYNRDDVEKCLRFNQSVLEFVKSNHISSVFLHARWAVYSEGPYGGRVAHPVVLTPSRDPQNNYGEFARLLTSTVDELQKTGASITVIASIPEVGVDVPTVLARQAAKGRSPELEAGCLDFASRQERTVHLFEALSEKYNVRVIFPDQLLCNGSSCATVAKNDVLYMDDSHLSIHGAMYLSPIVSPLLTAMR